MASDKNTMPKGTTHFLMRTESASYAMRVHDGWCLQDGEGGWVFCGEEVRGYKVDIRTGIIWHAVKPEEVLAYVHSEGMTGRMTATQSAPVLMMGAFYTITGEDVASWAPTRKEVSGPINYTAPYKKTPTLFSCPKMQALYDRISSKRRKGFPVRAGVSNEQDPWMPMETAPRDGRQLRLLVAFTEHSTDDDERGVTIGANYLEQNDLDEWLFAGWSWTQDCYTSGEGEVIGWMPLLSDDPKVGDPGFYGRMAARLRLKNSELNRDLAKAEKALNAAMNEIKELKNAK